MPVFHGEACMDCGGCVGICPHDAIDLFGGRILFRASCTECDLCVRLCPVEALASLDGASPRASYLPVRGLPLGGAPS